MSFGRRGLLVGVAYGKVSANGESLVVGGPPGGRGLRWAEPIMGVVSGV